MTTKKQRQANVDRAPPAKKKKNRPSGFSKCMTGINEAAKGQDMFGQEYQMKLEGGEQEIKSGLGTFCSLILLGITIIYAYQKLNIFLGKKDISIMLSAKDMYFNDQDRFTHKMGVNIAAAFSAYDSEKEWALDHRYGSLHINERSWGQNPDGTYFSTRTALKGHNCTRENLGLEGDPKNFQFFTPHSSAKSFVELYQKKFRCVDPDEMYIYGDFTTNEARLINVQLKKCRGHAYCKSDDEIKKYFATKYILILANQVRFSPSGFEEKTTIQESILMWMTINTRSAWVTPFKLTASELSLQDQTFNFDSLTEETK